MDEHLHAPIQVHREDLGVESLQKRHHRELSGRLAHARCAQDQRVTGNLLAGVVLVDARGVEVEIEHPLRHRVQRHHRRAIAQRITDALTGRVVMHRECGGQVAGRLRHRAGFARSTRNLTEIRGRCRQRGLDPAHPTLTQRAGRDEGAVVDRLLRGVAVHHKGPVIVAKGQLARTDITLRGLQLLDLVRRFVPRRLELIRLRFQRLLCFVGAHATKRLRHRELNG